MAPRPKRKRGKYHLDNPTIDDCIWCSKRVTPVSVVRCSKRNQAYHNRCAAQCGFIEQGVFKKCCDPLFLCPDLPPESNNEDDDEDSDASLSDDDQEDELDVLSNEANSSEAITKSDLVLLANSIENSFKSSIKKSRVSLGSRIDALVQSVNAVAATAKSNNEEITKLRTELTEQRNTVESLSIKCTENSEKIILAQNSVDELKSSIDNKIESAIENAQVNTSIPDIEQFYMELNDHQSRRKNLVLFKLADSNDSNADSTYMNNLLSKTRGLNLLKVKFRRIGIYDPKAKQPRPIIIRFEDQEDLYKILKNEKSIYKDVDIRTDKTFAQRQYINKKVEELKELNSTNPSDSKVLKCRLDVPYIANMPKNLGRNQRGERMQQGFLLSKR